MSKKHIPPAVIQDIIARSDIIEIIQARLTLVKRGHNYSARCPFHEEKTPSFSVNSEKQFYYCFGCGANGNVISFLMNYDHLEFVEALEFLAAQQGIELTDSALPQDQYNSQRAFAILQQAAAYYAKTLTHSSNALNYIKSRKLTAEICQQFMLGYAPPGWNNLQHNFAMNAELQEIFAVNGLFISKQSAGFYDRFRDRIIFPIHNISGHIIAFGGRAIDSKSEPKYLNSPETPLFQKGHELYGLYQVRQSTHKINYIIVVEGYLDVLTLHQHQFTTAVATMGTAVNPKHIQKILKYTNQIIFCFDGDLAGQKAAWKALTISLPLLKEGIDIRFLVLAAGDDPDSILNTRGAQYFKGLLQKTLSITDYFFQQLQQQINISSTAGKASFINQATSYLNTMPTGIYRHLLFQQLAKKVNIELQELQALNFSPNASSQNLTPIPSISRKYSASQSLSHPADSALTLLLKKPELAQKTNIDLLASAPSRKKSLLINILKIFQANDSLSIGELLEQIDSADEKQWIAKLASKELIIPDSGINDEYEGAISCLIQQGLGQKIRILVDKAKQTALNDTEKKELQLLLEGKERLR